MSREQQALVHPETKFSEAPTLQQATKLFFLSFRFAQANGEIQYSIFSYLHFLHPEWRMTDEFRLQLIEKARNPILKFLRNNNMHKQNVYEVEAAIDGEAKLMQRRFNEEDNASSPDINQLVSEIVERDRMFLGLSDKHYKLGRPGRHSQKSSRYNPLTDPFLSHICWYGIEGNPTGAWEYNRVFVDIKGEALRILRSDQSDEETEKIKTKLVAVINKYHKTHPNNKTALILQVSGIPCLA